jgi:hypothetical protein
MDPTAIMEQPSGFYAWIMEYGQIVAFLAQIIYWTGMLVLLFYAVWQFKRWVNFQLGTGRSGKLRDADADEKPSVDEFVE